jgi:hypothetical protein
MDINFPEPGFVTGDPGLDPDSSQFRNLRISKTVILGGVGSCK